MANFKIETTDPNTWAQIMAAFDNISKDWKVLEAERDEAREWARRMKAGWDEERESGIIKSRALHNEGLAHTERTSLYYGMKYERDEARAEIARLAARIAELERENAALKEAQRPIPVTERTPETNKTVFVFEYRESEDEYYPGIGFYGMDKQWYVESFSGWFEPTHWKPAPEADNGSK